MLESMRYSPTNSRRLRRAYHVLRSKYLTRPGSTRRRPVSPIASSPDCTNVRAKLGGEGSGAGRDRAAGLRCAPVHYSRC